MVFVILSIFVILAFVAGSLKYVYSYRGVARYENFSEYVRKGWPVFSPLNCLLYLLTQPRARAAIIDLKNFSELAEIKKHWQVIRDEAVALHQSRLFDKTKSPESAAYYDIGFRTFYKYGWSKFYLTWYGYTHESAKKHCPKTVDILKRVPSVNGAMFSILPVGSKLTRHLDPIACSLRYHLGLATPNDDRCYINIDNTSYSWRDGEALLFDETYLHYAFNNADVDRIILMCDVDRPMNIGGSFINWSYKCLARLTVVPNIPGDKQGLANIVFSKLAPISQWFKGLKQTHPKIYPFAKHTLNGVLALILLGIIASILSLIYRLLGTALQF